jgi:hypothetical protein
MCLINIIYLNGCWKQNGARPESQSEQHKCFYIFITHYITGHSLEYNILKYRLVYCTSTLNITSQYRKFLKAIFKIKMKTSF